jgi:hypothetical protein
VERNLDTAHDWFMGGAELGDPYSMLSLGDFYRDGLRGERDLVEALSWYQVSMIRLDPQDVGGLRFAESEANSINAILTQTQKQEAAARLEFLKEFTAPQTVEQNLDEGESRI